MGDKRVVEVSKMGRFFVILLFCIFITDDILASGIKEAVVCEGKKSTISCSTGHVIKVVQANYGRYSLSRCPSKHIKTTNCFNIRSTGEISKSCNGRKSCSLYASNSVFGDPCRGTYKYLRVLYRCQKSAQRRVVVCEGKTRRISCRKGLVISVSSASYGRRDRNTCPSSSIRTTSCSKYNSLSIVRANCQYKQSCLLQSNNLIFGDPCRGTYKYLSVSYRCLTPRHKEIVACEGKRRVIMCPRGKYIHILHANYGRTDVKTCPSRWIKTTRCFARNSTAKVASSCNGRRSCLLKPFNSVFGDPCRGTYKYLRVQYYC